MHYLPIHTCGLRFCTWSGMPKELSYFWHLLVLLRKNPAINWTLCRILMLLLVDMHFINKSSLNCRSMRHLVRIEIAIFPKHETMLGTRFTHQMQFSDSFPDFFLHFVFSLPFSVCLYVFLSTCLAFTISLQHTYAQLYLYFFFFQSKSSLFRSELYKSFDESYTNIFQIHIVQQSVK